MRIAFEDMFSALKEVRPSAMKEVTLEVPKVDPQLTPHLPLILETCFHLTWAGLVV